MKRNFAVYDIDGSYQVHLEENGTVMHVKTERTPEAAMKQVKDWMDGTTSTYVDPLTGANRLIGVGIKDELFEGMLGLSEILAMSRTYQIYRVSNSWPPWRADILDDKSKVVDWNLLATEDQAREWAEKRVNGSGIVDPYEGLADLSSGADWGNDYEPPTKTKDIETIPVSCYICGNKINANQYNNIFTSRIHLDSKCCGREEKKEFTAAEAETLVKQGWLAFLTF